jgi:hypothetical protein
MEPRGYGFREASRCEGPDLSTFIVNVENCTIVAGGHKTGCFKFFISLGFGMPFNAMLVFQPPWRQ